MKVTIIQFLLPDGRQSVVNCEVNDSLKEQYEAIKAAGCRLTAEVLTTGAVSQTVEHAEGDFDVEICPNKPDAPRAALEKLIARFDSRHFELWLAEMSTDGQL